jgi:hypothetical protein
MSDLVLLILLGLAVALVSAFINLKCGRGAPLLTRVSYFFVFAGLFYAAVMLILLTYKEFS